MIPNEAKRTEALRGVTLYDMLGKIRCGAEVVFRGDKMSAASWVKENELGQLEIHFVPMRKPRGNVGGG